MKKSLPGISVIIPVLNEERYLPKCLKSLRRFSSKLEIIVVDAKSSDQTEPLCRNQCDLWLTSERKSRAHQMNLGAESASGDLLLFLHADSILTKSAMVALSRSLSKGVQVGCLRRRYISRSVILQIADWIAPKRVRFLGIAYGDQGIFLQKSLFQKIGGFRESSVFEDVDLSKSVSKYTEIIPTTGLVYTSARRFRNNVTLWVLIRDALSVVLYRLKRSS